MFFPSIDFVDNNPQTNYHEDLYSISHHLQLESINNDLAAVQGSNPGFDLPYPFDPFINVHRGMFTDEDHLIETPLDLPVDHYNNLMDEGFEMISSSNIDASHETKKNTSKRKRVVDIKSDIIKGEWTPEEDRLLVDLVGKNGVGRWSSLAQMLPGRIGKQCRDRWNNHLKPNIKKDQWSAKEDQILIEAHMQLGNKWSEIARVLPGRSENTIKNHWNTAKRRQLSSARKGGRNSNSNNTPLQKYIRSIIKTGGVGGCLENSSGHSSDNNQVKWLKRNKMNDEIVDEESWRMESQSDLQNQMGFMNTFLQ